MLHSTRKCPSNTAPAPPMANPMSFVTSKKCHLSLAKTVCPLSLIKPCQFTLSVYKLYRFCDFPIPCAPILESGFLNSSTGSVFYLIVSTSVKLSVRLRFLSAAAMLHIICNCKVCHLSHVTDVTVSFVEGKKKGHVDLSLLSNGHVSLSYFNLALEGPL